MQCKMNQNRRHAFALVHNLVNWFFKLYGNVKIQKQPNQSCRTTREDRPPDINTFKKPHKYGVLAERQSWNKTVTPETSPSKHSCLHSKETLRCGEEKMTLFNAILHLIAIRPYAKNWSLLNYIKEQNFKVPWKYSRKI